MKNGGRREGEVQAGILAYLAIRKDCWCFRSNTGGVSFGKSFVKFGIKGAADIFCVQAPTGRAVGIECKREVGGVLSVEQERWGENLKRFGGLYIVASDVDTVAQALGEEQVRVEKVALRKEYPR